MKLEQLRENMEGFHPSDYGKVIRSGETYVMTERFLRGEIEDALARYRAKDTLDQEARLLRDKIDKALRRYHDYAIKEKLGKPGAHYRDATIAVSETKNLVFEHVIPIRYLVNALIQDRITIELAMNPPTCILRQIDDALLGRARLADRTPNSWWFWQRYAVLDLQIITHDGTAVDQSIWDLGTHIQHFGI